TRQALALDEFHRQVFEEGIIQVKLSFEGAVRHPPAALEHGNRLVQDLFKMHQHASIAILLDFMHCPIACDWYHPFPLPLGEGKVRGFFRYLGTLTPALSQREREQRLLTLQIDKIIWTLH